MTQKDTFWLKCMEFGGSMGCHQMPERSYFIRGYQFPLCARCTGVVISSFAALIVFWYYKLPLIPAALMLLIMFLDWLIQYLGIKESSNPRRLITGLLGGYGFVTLQLYLYVFIIKALISAFI